jgi:hypothetical protein
VPPGIEHLADFIGGFVVAEGTFVLSGTRRFTFAVGLGARDSSTCVALHTYFGCGSVGMYPRRKPHYDDECIFAIRGLADHVRVTIPFMDAHLPPSYKRQQYLVWRDQLSDYWEHRARRSSRPGAGGWWT